MNEFSLSHFSDNEKDDPNIAARKALPIAVLDSGAGGISVLSELIRLMPGERFIYLGDAKNAPYGSKTQQEVLHITLSNVEMLKKRGIKALVIACNTATSAAVEYLREKEQDLIIVGIEPAIKPASLVCERPKILVMATELTLNLPKYHVLAARFDAVCERIIPLPCPGLVEMIEQGDVDGERMHKYLAALFAPYLDTEIDAVVLGCTHYRHVLPAIRSFWGEKTAIIDGCKGTAEQTLRLLWYDGLINTEGEGSVEFLCTAKDEKRIALYRTLLARAKNVDLNG